MPEIQIKTGLEAAYQAYVEMNSGDFYGKGVVDYSEAWASLMEDQISAGSTVVEIAKETSHTADTQGITGFMYGCAVSALAHYWVHGEELRRWSNLDIQIGDEGEKANESGGVLNPALRTLEAGQMSPLQTNDEAIESRVFDTMTPWGPVPIGRVAGWTRETEIDAG